MPTFEFRCPEGHVFEKFSPTMNYRRTMACPTCGKRAQRLISGGAGLVFKGSGFYITDYKRPGGRGDQGGDQGGDGAKPAADQPAKKKATKKPKKDASSGES